LNYQPAIVRTVSRTVTQTDLLVEDRAGWLPSQSCRVAVSTSGWSSIIPGTWHPVESAVCVCTV